MTDRGVAVDEVNVEGVAVVVVVDVVAEGSKIAADEDIMLTKAS